MEQSVSHLLQQTSLRFQLRAALCQSSLPGPTKALLERPRDHSENNPWEFDGKKREVFVEAKLCEAEAPMREEKLSVSTSTSPCWLVEEFVVTEECTPCSNFQIKTMPECGSTGYVEKITCHSSKRNEFKSCRSALMEQRLFWKFEGTMVGVALVFACLVILRQRQLDREALEKVRKQIESI